MRSTRSTRPIQVLVALLFAYGPGSGAAHADAGLVVVGGTADDHVRSTVGTAIEDAARQAGWSLANPRLSRREADGLVSCVAPTPFACLPASLEAGGIHRVLVVTVDRAVSDSGAPELVLLGKLVVTSPRDVIVNRRFCESCADDRLAQESTQLAQDILRLLATQSGRTVVEVASEPAGAQVVLDGQRIGVTNGTFNTFPGKHVVILEKLGYASERKELTVGEGKTVTVSATLRVSAVPGVPELPGMGEPPRRPRLVPGAVIGLGAVALVGGIVLYAVDQDPSLTGDKRYRDTAPAGVAIGVAGLAVLGAGAYLWRRGSARTSGPAAAVARGGVVVGWCGAF